MTFNLQRLRYERMSRKVSQQVMANRLGMNHTSYWKRENGHVPITINEFIKILEVLEIPEEDAMNFFNQNVAKREQITK